MQHTKTTRGINSWKKGIIERDRVVLAQAITLIESTLQEDMEMGSQLIQEIAPYAGNSLRIGITGSPGVGKSSFIETFGLHAASVGRKIAVLSIDPTSKSTRGSILGDKTRMEELSKHRNAFIRPSPSGSMLGGVADKTREAIMLCEAAGFDLILVETVGVGQSETLVRNMVDFFLLLLLPGGGDDLQGIKKGIVEMADGLVITKADGDSLMQAKRTQTDFIQALQILHSHDKPAPKVLTSSAVTGDGIEAIWSMIGDFYHRIKESGELEQRRQHQDLDWFEEQFNFLFKQRLNNSPVFQTDLRKLRDLVANQKITPTSAAMNLVNTIIPQEPDPETKKQRFDP